MKFNKLSLVSVGAISAVILIEIILAIKYIYQDFKNLGALMPIQADLMETPPVLILSGVLALVGLITGIISFMQISKSYEKGKILALFGSIFGFLLILRTYSMFNF